MTIAQQHKTDVRTLLMNHQDVTEAQLTEACATSIPSETHEGLLARVNAQAGNTPFHYVTTRSGWYRMGGVVSRSGERIAPNLRQWADEECGSDMFALYADYADKDLATTRYDGKMHYFVAPFGEHAGEFVQLEVEEVVEVIDRPLFVNDDVPDDVEELCDPAGALEARLEPIILKSPRYAMHIVTDIATLHSRTLHPEDTERRYTRFLQEWDESTAGLENRFCDHFVLKLLPFLDRFGEHKMEATPIPVKSMQKPDAEIAQLSGAPLANALQAYNREAGFPMAWYFMMLIQKDTLVDIAHTVYLDYQRNYRYLAERDFKILENWIRRPYNF